MLNSSLHVIGDGNVTFYNHSHGHATNAGGGGGGGSQFFDTYYSATRFSTETMVSVLAISSNCMVLAMAARLRPKKESRKLRAAGHIRLLIFHLTLANTVSSATLWFTGNTLYLFSRQMAALYRRNACHFYNCLVAGIFATSTFAVAAKLHMLGVAIIQYVSVCQPFRYRPSVVRKRLYIFIASVWCFSVVSGLGPATVLVGVSSSHACTRWLRTFALQVLSHGVEASAAIDIITYSVTACLFARVYVQMRIIRRDMQHFRLADDAREEMTSTLTIVVIEMVLILFSLGHVALHILSLSGSSWIGLNNRFLIYYMNLTPYAKLTVEPIVYSMRMRGLFKSLLRWMQQLKCCLVVFCRVAVERLFKCWSLQDERKKAIEHILMSPRTMTSQDV